MEMSLFFSIRHKGTRAWYVRGEGRGRYREGETARILVEGLKKGREGKLGRGSRGGQEGNR